MKRKGAQSHSARHCQSLSMRVRFGQRALECTSESALVSEQYEQHDSTSAHRLNQRIVKVIHDERTAAHQVKSARVHQRKDLELLGARLVSHSDKQCDGPVISRQIPVDV